MHEKREFQARSERIEELVHALENSEDPKTHAVAMELLQSVMELHGVGLEKMLALISQGSDSERLLDEFAKDDLISSLLLLHELHPDDIETRVLCALDRVRPDLLVEGSDVELLGIDEGVVRLRLQAAAGGGCHSTSAEALKGSLQDLVCQAAPDASQILIDVLERPRPAQLVTLK